MGSRAWLTWFVPFALCACDFASPRASRNEERERDSVEASGPALECAPRGQAWTEVEALYNETEESVHELITCGQLQIQIASDIVLMLITSNEDLFMEDEREALGMVRVNPFAQAEDGTWTMVIGGSPGSTFTLSFYDPDSGELITQDVFDLDNYLEGVHIQTEVGAEEMLADWDQKHAFTFRWESEGPLAHLMNGGEALPDGFELQLSISDFLSSDPADFGPFASVFELEADSVVRFVNHRADTDVEVDYRVTAVRDQLAHMAESESLGFEVDHLRGSAGELELDGNTDDLTFVRRGELAGRIDYDLSGIAEGASVHMRVTSEFGTGAAYPEAQWSCP